MAKIEKDKPMSAREKAIKDAMYDLGVMCGENEELRMNVARAFAEYAKEKSEKAEKNKTAWAYTIKHIKEKIIKEYLTPEEEEEADDEKFARFMKEGFEKNKEAEKKKAEKKKKKDTKTEVKQ